jgi:cellulose synthase/poly-beta-1,6-N-acetylglucosamine synthase-like glycosyltransferase
MNLTTEVLVCTYNGASFVVEQLDSILKQTMRVDRISIYDDRSSDDTISVIREFVNSLPSDQRCLFYVHVNETNLGYARNFQNAIAKSVEDVLFLCDQDDVWEPTKVEGLLKLLVERGADMVFSDGSLVDQSGRTIEGTTVLRSYGLTRDQIAAFGDGAFELLMKRNYVNGASCAIRRVAAMAALPLPCDMPHDYWLAIWCSLHKGTIATPRCLYRYRQHGENVIGIGSTNLLYTWLGFWRQPTIPRERELRIWQSVTNRITELRHLKEVEIARRKLQWLTEIVMGDKRSWSRARKVLKSALNGSYGTYSTKQALVRDVLSFLK